VEMGRRQPGDFFQKGRYISARGGKFEEGNNLGRGSQKNGKKILFRRRGGGVAKKRKEDAAEKTKKALRMESLKWPGGKRKTFGDG